MDEKIEVKGIWEYFVVDINNPGDIAAWTFDPLGNEGWDLFEIIMFGPGVFPMGKLIFKRYRTVAV